MPKRCVFCRLNKRDYERVRQIAAARDESMGAFVKRAIKFEFKRLGYATQEEIRALGEEADSSLQQHNDKRGACNYSKF